MPFVNTRVIRKKKNHKNQTAGRFASSTKKKTCCFKKDTKNRPLAKPQVFTHNPQKKKMQTSLNSLGCLEDSGVIADFRAPCQLRFAVACVSYGFFGLLGVFPRFSYGFRVFLGFLFFFFFFFENFPRVFLGFQRFSYGFP